MNIIKKLIYVILALLILAIIGLVVFSQTPTGKLYLQTIKTNTECMKKGGNAYRDGSGGIICNISYSDGGKKCTSSDQCLGDCVTDKDENLGKEGVCESKSAGNTCFTEINENRIFCRVDDMVFTKDDYEKIYNKTP